MKKSVYLDLPVASCVGSSLSFKPLSSSVISNPFHLHYCCVRIEITDVKFYDDEDGGERFKEREGSRDIELQIHN